MRKVDEIKEAITEEIINLLETADPKQFDKGWLPPAEQWAENPESGTVYRGMNQLYLSLICDRRHYGVNRWLTFNQIQHLKANITKGSKGTHVIYFALKKRQDQPPTEKPLLVLRYYYVFNVSSVEGLPAAYYLPPAIPTLQPWEKNQRAEQLINNTGAKVNYIVGDRACYNSLTDEITLPMPKQFIAAVPFYSVAFHELAHWTGAPTRLNREKSGKFGDEKYAFEELIAELSAAFLCGSLGYTKEITNNALYIKSWLTALRNEKDFIFKAAHHAHEAAEYIQEAAHRTAHTLP